MRSAVEACHADNVGVGRQTLHDGPYRGEPRGKCQRVFCALEFGKRRLEAFSIGVAGARIDILASRRCDFVLGKGG